MKDTVKVFKPMEWAAKLAETLNVPIKIVIASEARTSNQRIPTLAIPSLRYSFNVRQAIALKKHYSWNYEQHKMKKQMTKKTKKDIEIHHIWKNETAFQTPQTEKTHSRWNPNHVFLCNPFKTT